MELWFAKFRDSSFVRMTPERNDFVINCPRRAELFQVCKGRAYAISPYETWRKSLGLGLSSNPFHPGSKTKSWSILPSRLASGVEPHPGSNKKKRPLQPHFIYTIKSTNSWTGISLILS